MYHLFTSLFRCKAPDIVVVFFFFLSTFFNSLYFHCSILAPYLNTTTAHSFIAVFLLFPFNFDYSTNQSLRLYFFYRFFFHFILSDIIQFNYAQICVSFLFDLLHYFTIWELYPSHLTTSSVFMVRIPHFSIPNFITSVLKT